MSKNNDDLEKAILGCGAAVAGILFFALTILGAIARKSPTTFSLRRIREQLLVAIISAIVGLLVIVVRDYWPDVHAAGPLFRLGHLNFTLFMLLSWLALNACLFAPAYLTAPLWAGFVAGIGKSPGHSSEFRL